MATITLPLSSNTANHSRGSADHTHKFIHLSDTYLPSLNANTRKNNPFDNINKWQTTPFPISLGRIAEEDGELSVFSAEKYFKGGMDEKKTTKMGGPRDHSRKEEWKNQTKSNNKPGTSSASSEANWTSQSALLPTIGEKSLTQHRKVVSGKPILDIFGCKCASANILEHSRSKERSENLNFDLGISKSVPGSETAVRQSKEPGPEKAQRSLEVFGSPIVDIGERRMSLERRFRMLNWDVEKICNDDTESDTSSDLFEINTVYEPTEVSIEWSVVTANATNSDNQKSLAKPGKVMSKRSIKTYPIGLWGCRNEDTVNVAAVHTRRYQRSDSSFPN